MLIRFINWLIKKNGSQGVSDGFHTFYELYWHRHQLFICLMHSWPQYAWKSKTHSDGSSIEGWFIAGMFKENGKQITYHLPLSLWGAIQVDELEKAPEYDGHTAKNVAFRLYKLHQLLIDK